MPPCPVPARSAGSCWQRTCSTRCIVMLPSGFCPHYGARGLRRGGPQLPALPPPSQLWGHVCAPLLQSSNQGPAVGLLRWNSGLWQPLTSCHQQWVPMPFLPGETSQRATLAPGVSTNTVEKLMLALPHTVAMEMITLSHADILPPRAPGSGQPCWHSLWGW